MLDPKLQHIISNHLTSDCIVVFDEAHNIDQACVEAFSLNINLKTLEEADVNLEEELKIRLKQIRDSQPELLDSEILLLKGKDSNLHALDDFQMSYPIASHNFDNQICPGNIRKPEHFMTLLKKIIVFFKS